jgi:uncharacterized protein with GYD domain
MNSTDPSQATEPSDNSSALALSVAQSNRAKLIASCRARAIKKSATRTAGFRKAAESAGIAIQAPYWTAGAHDGVIFLGGDERKSLHGLTDLAAAWNVWRETMQVLDATEFGALTRQCDPSTQ